MRQGDVIRAATCLMLANSAMAAVTQQFGIVCQFPAQVGGVPGPNTNLVVGNDGNLYVATASTGLNYGTVFGVTPSSGSLTTVYAYPPPGAFPHTLPSPLSVGVDGALYGVDITHSLSVFRLTSDGSFSDIATIPNGFYTTPYFGLLAASDGSFYGVGFDNTGSFAQQIYRITPNGNVTLIHTLDPNTEGTKPFNLVQGSDGNIYGATSKVFFAILPGGVFTVLTTFPIPVNTTNPADFEPDAPACGTGLVQSSDGNFYCLNGAGESASILGLSPAGQMVLYQDLGSPSGSRLPEPVGNVYAPLVLGADGNLYGVSVTSAAVSNIFQITNTGKLSIVYATAAGDGGGGGSGTGFLGLALGQDGTLYGASTPTRNYPNGYIFKLGPGTGGTPIVLSFIAPALLDAQPAFVTTSSLNGTLSGLVSDPTVLVGSGRTVVGAAADGVSRVLLRAVATTTLEYTLLDENMNPIGYSTEYGGLAQAAGTGTLFANAVPVPPVVVNGRQMAFVAYRAPMDFVRSDPNFNASDQSAVSRTVNIQVTAPDGTPVATYPITLVRPPVVVIHGITSAPRYWKTFKPLVNNCAAPTVSGDPRFYVACADWSKKVPGVVSISPNYLGVGSLIMAFTPIRQNVLGYSYNAPIVFSQMQNAVANYSLAAPQAGKQPVASVQVDVVAHSMGNPIARTMPYTLLPPNSYLQTSNYGLGIMHKVISLSGPHFGSPMAIVALDPKNVCSWTVAAATGNYPLNAANFATSVTTGGALDLTGDGQGNCVSPALNLLQGTADKQIPTALIAGEMSTSQLTGLDSSLQALAIKLLLGVKAVQLACSTDYEMQDYNSVGWLTMTKTTAASQSDAFVPVTSSFDGLDQSQACVAQNGQAAPMPCGLTAIQYAVHGPGTSSQLGFPEPQMLDNPSVVLTTINLLNAKASSPVFSPLPSHMFNQVGGCK
jgi:hypothetical protein